ncbi:hypothetical protein [uncultured Corynebacterium sp.]|uniref:hypothetical protein n=1 Tax=uncultured Corynebacterium sp. TaxID=159447 RepID=UPI0025969170|nr:hypothetical protein [uncultured Corynebacterium sp.]
MSLKEIGIRNVFVGGSRIGVETLMQRRKVAEALDQFAQAGYSILVGDANGADRFVQEHYARLGYDNVTVYHSAQQPRNLVDPSWKVVAVGTESGLKGRELMTLKDEAMASESDAAFMIWDDFHKTRFGKWAVSSGTLNNMINTVIQDNLLLVYYVPTDSRFKVRSVEDLVSKLIDRPRGKDDEENNKNRLLMKKFESMLKNAQEQFQPVVPEANLQMSIPLE